VTLTKTILFIYRFLNTKSVIWYWYKTPNELWYLIYWLRLEGLQFSQLWRWRLNHISVSVQRFSFHPVTVINLRGCSRVHFNLCVWYVLVKWTYILEAMMHRFPSIRQTVSSDLFKEIWLKRCFEHLFMYLRLWSPDVKTILTFRYK
jgi:hypothetical protein